MQPRLATRQAIDAIPGCISQHDLSHVSAVITGGAVVPQVTRQAVNSLFNKNVFRDLYAFTEASGLISIKDAGSPAGPTTCVGKPFPNIEGRIVDDNGDPVAQKDQPGNLLWRTLSIMIGYWCNSSATSAALKDD